MKVYVLYENADWLAPLEKELKKAGLDYELWFLHQGSVDLQKAPPQGIYLNRISPSSHTRDHLDSIHFNRAVLRWLEAHNQVVINGADCFEFEVSKVHQYTSLEKFGIRTPKTKIVCGGEKELKKVAAEVDYPFVSKHNCGGKGQGVQLFHNQQSFESMIPSLVQDPPIDSIYLLQEYIQSPQKRITRVEIVGQEFQYAIYSDTSRGFELCPAEACEIGDAFCPVGEEESQKSINRQSLFSLREGFQDDPIVQKYIDFMKEHKIDVAGIEFIENENGEKVTYDINCTTNYSPGVEEAHGLSGMAALVRLIQSKSN